MFLSCSHGATGDGEEKHNLKGLFLLPLIRKMKEGV